MQEIRFRYSEDKLLEEQLKRRKAHKWIGALHCACDKCGSYQYVMLNIVDKTCECERCWAERRYFELVDGKETNI